MGAWSIDIEDEDRSSDSVHESGGFGRMCVCQRDAGFMVDLLGAGVPRSIEENPVGVWFFIAIAPTVGIRQPLGRGRQSRWDCSMGSFWSREGDGNRG
jgi:hypothetical protein